VINNVGTDTSVRGKKENRSASVGAGGIRGKKKTSRLGDPIKEAQQKKLI
jgi:hypothetical protein